MEHPGADGRQFEHLLVAYVAQLAGGGLHARVGGEDAFHVRVDLAALGAQRGGERDGRRVGAAAAERGDVQLFRDPLEAGDDAHPAALQLAAEAGGVEREDARSTVGHIGAQAGLGAGEAHGVHAHGVERHGQEGHRDRLSGGEEQVELACLRLVSQLAREGKEAVGGVTHRRDDDDEPVARAGARRDASGDVADALGVGDRGAAVLLDDEGHLRCSCASTLR